MDRTRIAVRGTPNFSKWNVASNPRYSPTRYVMAPLRHGRCRLLQVIFAFRPHENEKQVFNRSVLPAPFTPTTKIMVGL